MNELVDAVETELFSREEKEIDSKVIGEIVMERLKISMLWPMCGLHRCTGELRMSIPSWMN